MYFAEFKKKITLHVICFPVSRQIQNKYNVSFGNDSAVVSYLNNHTYIYDPEKSQLKEEDLITTANFFFWVSRIFGLQLVRN